MTKRTDYDQRYAALDREFSSWLPHYRQIGDYLLPRKGRFLQDKTEANRGDRRDQFILDSTGTRAARTLSAGMMAGMTSPARPWFRLVTGDPDLDNRQSVKEWTHAALLQMRRIFSRSNTYRALHSCYDELGGFGTGVSLLLENRDRVIHQHPLTVGEYRLATNSLGEVDTLYRNIRMTVSQVVQEFGKDACSPTIRSMYDKGNLDSWVDVRHVIEPRHDRDTSKRDNLNMPFRSVYYEVGANEGQFLRESGFEEFPALAARWAVNTGDVYGRSPGMDALGDVMQLQHMQEKKLKAIDFQADPPVQIPLSMKGMGYDLLPGGESYYDEVSGPNSGIRSAFEVPLNLSYLSPEIMDARQNINAAFYADLFQMLAQSDRRQMTATEVAERHEEKLLMLGPVLERLHNELLDPLIDRTFAMAMRAGVMPPPPRELEGMDLRVEYVSMLAQAQQAVSVTAVDRLLGTVANVSQFKPEILDKLDADAVVDAYADMLGVPPDLIVAGEEVALVRERRAQQQQAQQQAEAIPQAAVAAKTLSETDVEGDNALTRMFTGL